VKPLDLGLSGVDYHPYRWRLDGETHGQARNKAEDRRIGKNHHQSRPVDLGQIDLLVQEGFYSTAPI
jgi:hypothetical protein